MPRQHTIHVSDLQHDWRPGDLVDLDAIHAWLLSASEDPGPMEVLPDGTVVVELPDEPAAPAWTETEHVINVRTVLPDWRPGQPMGDVAERITDALAERGVTIERVDPQADGRVLIVADQDPRVALKDVVVGATRERRARGQALTEYRAATAAVLTAPTVPIVVKAWIRALNVVLRLVVVDLRDEGGGPSSTLP